MSQRCKINPMVGMQMRDCNGAELRQPTDAELRRKWRVRPMAQVKDERCAPVLNYIS
jgi:hypothetical protein